MRGRGQRLAVDLATGQQRQSLQDDERGRHHVFGQDQTERAFEQGGVRRAAGHVGDEPQLTGGAGLGEHDAVADAALRIQCGFDFAEFDAVAADLDL